MESPGDHRISLRRPTETMLRLQFWASPVGALSPWSACPGPILAEHRTGLQDPDPAPAPCAKPSVCVNPGHGSRVTGLHPAARESEKAIFWLPCEEVRHLRENYPKGKVCKVTGFPQAGLMRATSAGLVFYFKNIVKHII